MYLMISVVDRDLFVANPYPDLNLHFDAAQDPDPDPTPSFTHVGKNRKLSGMPVYIVSIKGN